MGLGAESVPEPVSETESSSSAPEVEGALVTEELASSAVEDGPAVVEGSSVAGAEVEASVGAAVVSA